MSKLRIYNERIKICSGEQFADNRITLFVRVDDDGDYWLETDGDECIWIPRELMKGVVTAFNRVQKF